MSSGMNWRQRPVIYYLDEAGEPQACRTDADRLRAEAQLGERGALPWRVGKTCVAGCRVSTVFLWVDHGIEQPVLWETMCFGGPFDLGGRRYTSREDARLGHRRTVKLLRWRMARRARRRQCWGDPWADPARRPSSRCAVSGRSP